MLKIFKIFKSKKPPEKEEASLPAPKEEEHPQISLFISADQLLSLNEDDEEREECAKMYLRTAKRDHLDSNVYIKNIEVFEKSFSKLGNTDQQCPHCRRVYTTVPAEIQKCLGCSKSFFKTKRPQDGLTVLVREENREVISMQWENIKKPDTIIEVNLDELETRRLQLEFKTKTPHTLYDTHNLLVEKYLEKSLFLGKFRLYSSLIYYKAEYYRFKREFSKALTHYFYLYFLELNGASNSVVFGDKVSVNKRTIDAISALLKMSKTVTTESKDLFTYAIKSLNAFDLENLPYNIDESYKDLVNRFEKAEGR